MKRSPLPPPPSDRKPKGHLHAGLLCCCALSYFMSHVNLLPALYSWIAGGEHIMCTVGRTKAVLVKCVSLADVKVWKAARVRKERISRSGFQLNTLLNNKHSKHHHHHEKGKKKKHEIRNGHICFSSSFPHQQYFTFSYTHDNILVALQKSLEVMCCFISVSYNGGWGK